MKHIKKQLSFFVLLTFVCTLLPLRIFAAADATMMNLTQNKGVSVSATVQDGVAAGVADGDNQNAAKATESSKGAWTYFGKNAQSVTVDLGGMYCISKIKAYMGYAKSGADSPESFSIMYSTDGEKYITAVNETSGYSFDYEKIFAGCIGARYVKLYVGAAEVSRVVRVREIEIIGCSIYDKSINITSYADLSVSCSPNDSSILGIIDGDTESANTHNGGGAGAWVYSGKAKRTLDVNLNSVYHIDSIKLYFGYRGAETDRPQAFTVSTTNDMTAYTEVLKIDSGVNGEHDITVDGNIRAVRLEIPSAPESRVVRVREMQIIGHPLSAEQLGMKADIAAENDYIVLYDDNAVVNAVLTNHSAESKTYSVEYSTDGKNYLQAASAAIAPGEVKTQAVDLSALPKGKYSDFSLRVYFDGVLVKQFENALTVIKHNKEKPLSEYSRIGVNWHIEYSANRKQNGRYNELINLLGIDKTRSIHRWAWLETKKGSRPFEKNDEVDLQMAKYNQCFAPYILGFGNTLYFDEEPRTYSDVINEIDYNKQIITDLTQKGIDIKSLEIWNEPNLQSFWKSNRSITYSQFANRMGFEMKKLYPDKQIMGGAIASSEGGTDYLDKYFSRGALMYTDEFSFHPYTYAMPGGQNKYDTQYYDKLANIMQSRNKAGGWVNATATEIGYPTHDMQTTRYGITDEQQAARIPKYYIMNDDLDVAATDLYTFEDTGSDPSDPEQNFGLVQYDLVPKDSYVSMAQLVNHLADSEYIGRFSLDSGDYMYVYTSLDGIFAATWSNDASKSFSLPLDNGVIAEDLYGNIIENSGTITITSKPVYLTNLTEEYLFRAAAAQADTKINQLIADYSASLLIDASRLNAIKAAFATADTAEKLKVAVDAVYAYGDEIAEAYADNSSEVDIKDLAVALAMLERTAKHGLIAYSHFNRSAQSSSEMYENVKSAIAAKKGSEPQSSLLYTDAMMRFAQRYNQKANEIKANYPGTVGIAAAYDDMASAVLNWAEIIMNYETPNNGRAVFSYLADTNPTVTKGERHDYVIEIENQLNEHAIDGDLVLKDSDGNLLGAAVKCTVAPGECGEFTVNGIVPHDTEDGPKTLYLDLIEEGTILKHCEIEASIISAEDTTPIVFYDVGIYNNNNEPATYKDLHKEGVLSAQAYIKKTGTVSDAASAVCAVYGNDGLEEVEMVSINDFGADNEYLMKIPVRTTDKTDCISLYLWDIKTLTPLYDKVILKNRA